MLMQGNATAIIAAAKKAGMICSSACHRNNFNCVNNDRREMFLPK
jgi:hypothetical protein